MTDWLACLIKNYHALELCPIQDSTDWNSKSVFLCLISYLPSYHQVRIRLDVMYHGFSIPMCHKSAIVLLKKDIEITYPRIVDRISEPCVTFCNMNCRARLRPAPGFTNRSHIPKPIEFWATKTGQPQRADPSAIRSPTLKHHTSVSPGTSLF